MSQMGESRHTPGPWAVDPNYEDSDKHIGIVAPPSTYALAWADNDDVPEDEGLANARLIAAAPLMLEALRRGLAWLTLPPGATLGEASIESAKNALREGIKAATGGEP